MSNPPSHSDPSSTSVVPEKHRALLFFSTGKLTVASVDTPRPGREDVLVRVHASALNAVEPWLCSSMRGSPACPIGLGMDGAGVVVSVPENMDEQGPGEETEQGEWRGERQGQCQWNNPGRGRSCRKTVKVGDRVFFQAPFVNGSPSKAHAAFQEYALADKDMLWKIPAHISFEQAATLPTALTVAYTGLYSSHPHGLGFDPPLPGCKRKQRGISIIVISGATSIGQMTIQLAKLSGLGPIIATASLKHTAWLKSLGATHVVDRHRSLTRALLADVLGSDEPIYVIFDCVSSRATLKAALDILHPGGTVANVLPSMIRPSYEKRAAVEEKKIAKVVGNKAGDCQTHLMKRMRADVSAMFESKELKPLRYEVLPTGLNAVEEGIARLNAGVVSGMKLLIRP